MKRINFYYYCATLYPIGLAKMPGTIASFASLPLAYACSFLPPIFLILLFVIMVTVSYFVIQKVLPCFMNIDPSEIVLDELLGVVVTFAFLPLNGITLIFGFLLFRFFDITKYGLVWAEKIPGPTGIILDDIVAGLLSNLGLRIVMLWL